MQMRAAGASAAQEERVPASAQPCIDLLPVDPRDTAPMQPRALLMAARLQWHTQCPACVYQDSFALTPAYADTRLGTNNSFFSFFLVMVVVKVVIIGSVTAINNQSLYRADPHPGLVKRLPFATAPAVYADS